MLERAALNWLRNDKVWLELDNDDKDSIDEQSADASLHRVGGRECHARLLATVFKCKLAGRKLKAEDSCT